MPSGQTHNLINVVSFAVLGSAALLLDRADALNVPMIEGGVFTAAYFAGTFLLSPDLDLAEGNVSSKRAWGLLGVLWVPYGLLFSHRGWSHSWLVGPLTRLVYLALMVVLALGLVSAGGAALGWSPQDAAWWGWLRQTPPWSVTVAFLSGYYLSQWLHLVADGIRPDHKMRLRSRARR